MAGIEAHSTKNMLDLHDLNIEYRVSPRRKSIGIMVTTEAKVVVILPRGASRESLAQALEKHRGWIEAKVAERQTAWGQLKEGEAYFLGEAFRLTVLRGATGAVSLNGQEIRVALPERADLWPRLAAWYAEHALARLQARVAHFAASMGLSPGPVVLKGWKQRWGECHPDGTLKFNWRLIMCPPSVIDYVVVHELAHLKVPGHNPRFWGQVAKILPDYAGRRHWLNREGAPFLLWRPEPGLDQ
jgi:predicted metal-dependent hydrolase